MPFPTYARLHHRSEGPSAKLKDCKCVTGALFFELKKEKNAPLHGGMCSGALCKKNQAGGLFAPVVVPVHGIALHASGTGAAATVADGVVACEVGADTIYWAGTDDALLL